MPKIVGRAGLARSRNEKSRHKPGRVATINHAKRVRVARLAYMRKRMFALAENFMKLGWRIIPTEYRGKRPVAGLSLHDASTDIAKFREQAKDCLRFGIGLAPGVSSGVVIVDIDQPGAKARRKKLEAEVGKLPATIRSRTGGGGYHWFFAAPEEPLKSRHLDGLDLLGEKTLAILPGSAGRQGRPYSWLEGRNPCDIQLAPLPPKLEAFWREKAPGVSRRSSLDASEKVLEGSRNTFLTSQAGVLASNGVRGEALFERLMLINTEQCSPPLEEQEVKSIAANIDRAAKPEEVDVAERVRQAVLRRHFADGAHLIFASDGRFYAFHETHWEILPEKILKKLIFTQAQAVPKAGKPNQIIAQVYDLLTITCTREGDPLHFHEKPPAILNLLNGELHLRPNGKHRLKPHDPASGLRHVIRLSYDLKAKCPEFDQTLKEIFSEAEEPQALIDFLLELFAYVLQPDRNIPLFVVAYGRGANGKTKLFNLLVSMLGRQFVHFGQIQDLEGDRFALGSLLGKLLFIDDDVKTNIKLSDGLLKKLSEPKMMTGQLKFKDNFEFECRALPILLTNNFPSVNDVSDGFMRRLHVVPFRRQFLGKKQDLDLFERIQNNEMPGVLNRILQAWVRLTENKAFTVGADMREARIEMLRQANPLKGYVDEEWVPDPKAKVPMAAFYSSFRQWAQTNGYTMTQSQPIVRRNLEHMGYRVPRRGSGGRTVIGLRKR
ncbi:phage/plasmid primase, P4 family [Phreatobacter oligotrophus]|uniref:phage/plasmid primase, P4 family n=1 Tax=Phreatobacter oligotrophus TaxID=1122261 RepID=UPI002354E351|nr:phage/plasmid primase, P4 family [Phreatobacter oligotrophus]MBX9989352.1 bifunctional DNA primase/polymerase [Phreatobacter oligotrophus]